MDSSELLGFASWEKWCANSPEHAPNKPGVYVFRLVSGRALGRLKGRSDLIYIGCTTKGKRTIRDRLKDHLAVQPLGRNTGYRLHRVQQEVGPLEVSWKPFESHTDAKEHERTLLGRYEKDHIELPPLNRQEAGKKVRQTEELLDAVTQGQGRKVLKEVLARKEQS